MTDETRELLELAAKAAGHEIVEWFAYDDGDIAADILCEWGRELWEPHGSLDDALRLAVDLGIIVHANHGDKESVCYDDMSTGYSELWANHPDKYRATCMAITRAAAEIGRRMK